MSDAARAALDIIAERNAEKTKGIPWDMCYQIAELAHQDAATDQLIREVVESFGFEMQVKP